MSDEEINAIANTAIDQLSEGMTKKKKPSLIISPERDFRGWLSKVKHTTVYRQTQSKLLQQDDEKFTISGIWLVFCISIILFFLKNLITDSFLINFSIDLIAGAGAGLRGAQLPDPLARDPQKQRKAVLSELRYRGAGALPHHQGDGAGQLRYLISAAGGGLFHHQTQAEALYTAAAGSEEVLNEKGFLFLMKIHENEQKNDATASICWRKIRGERTAQKNVKLRKSPCIKGFGLLQYTSDREDVRGC